MQKVPLTSWGGSKVRNRMKTLWPVAKSPDPALADNEFGQYQQSLATTVQNVNELIDSDAEIRRILDRRPF